MSCLYLSEHNEQRFRCHFCCQYFLITLDLSLQFSHEIVGRQQILLSILFLYICIILTYCSNFHWQIDNDHTSCLFIKINHQTSETKTIHMTQSHTNAYTTIDTQYAYMYEFMNTCICMCLCLWATTEVYIVCNVQYTVWYQLLEEPLKNLGLSFKVAELHMRWQKLLTSTVLVSLPSFCLYFTLATAPFQFHAFHVIIQCKTNCNSLLKSWLVKTAVSLLTLQQSYKKTSYF